LIPLDEFIEEEQQILSKKKDNVLIDTRTDLEKRSLLMGCFVGKRPGERDDWLKETRVCLVCKSDFFPIRSPQSICEDCCSMYNLQLTGNISKKTRVAKYGRWDVCSDCGKYVCVDGNRDNKGRIVRGKWFCSDCKNRRLGNVQIKCLFNFRGCEEQVFLHYSYNCKTCSIIIKQKYCPSCGCFMLPPASNYKLYNGRYFCCNKCIDTYVRCGDKEEECEVRDIVNVEKKEKIMKNVETQVMRVKDNGNCSNSIVGDFVRKEIEGRKTLTVGNIIDIADKYVNYRADDYRDEGREQLRHNIEEKEKEINKMRDKHTRKEIQLLKLIPSMTICLRSGKSPDSRHHIIPREFDTNYEKEVVYSLVNISLLETKAHDEVQIVGDKYIKEQLSEGNHPTIPKLVSFIYFGFPGEDTEKIDKIRRLNIRQQLTSLGCDKNDANADVYAIEINNVLADKVKRYSKTRENKWFMTF